MNEDMKVVKKDYKITVEFNYPEFALPSESDHDEYKMKMYQLTKQILEDEFTDFRYEFANEGYIPTFKIEVKDSRD